MDTTDYTTKNEYKLNGGYFYRGLTFLLGNNNT